MALVDVSTLTTKFNGRGVKFNDFFYKSSPLFSAIFYDWDSLKNPSTALRAKEISMANELLEDGYTIKWRDTDLRRATAQLNGALVATTTTWTVDDSSMLKAGDNIYAQSSNGITHVITSVTNSTTIVVTPGVPTGGYADDTVIKIVSSAIDAAGTVDGKDTYMPVSDTDITNYIQHFSHSFALSQEQLNKVMLKYTSSGLSEKQAVMKYVQDTTAHTLRQMQHDIVSAFWLGSKASATAGVVRRYTGGINDYISGTTDCTDSTDKARLIKIIDALDTMQSIQDMDGNYSNILVLTRKAKSRLSAMASDYVQGVDTIELSKIGFRIEVIRTTYGDIPVYVDPILTDLVGDTNMGYAMNPKMIQMISTANLPPTEKDISKGSVSVGSLAGIQFFSNDTTKKQPNSSATINAYTNLGFAFKGSGLGLYRKLINIGA